MQGEAGLIAESPGSIRGRHHGTPVQAQHPSGRPPGGPTGWARPDQSSYAALIAQHSIDSAIVKLSVFKAEFFDQLARPRALADASPAASFPEIDSREFLREDQQRLGS
jgi:hypothetical protein